MTTRPALRGRTIGLRIKEAYEAQGLTRAAFQRLLQKHDPALATLNYKTIIDWENGSIPRLRVLRAIASVLGYALEEISEDPAGQEADDAAVSGILSEKAVAELIDRLGGSSKVKTEVAYELTAYPPAGGVTRDEVVRVHRLVSRANAQPVAPEPPENATIDEEIKGLGYKNVEPDELRRRHGEAMQDTKAEPPAKPRRRRGDG